MSQMDVDLDLECSDRISDFLRSKLQEIKSENAELEAALLYREETVRELRQSLSKTPESSLIFGESWKRTIDGRYVLGVELKNDSACALTNITVTLTWTSSLPLSYKFYLLSLESFKSLTNLTDSAQIIIVLNIPFFTDHLAYTISGLVTFQRDSKKVHVKFPSPFQLTPGDITDGTVAVDLYKAIGGSKEDFLSIVTSGERQEFMLILPQSFTVIENALELDCGFHRVSLRSERKFFLAYKISPAIDGTLVEVEGNSSEQVVQLNTYNKNLETTVALLHYLHSHIIGVVIIPKSLYRPDLTPTELTDLAKVSLLEELDHLGEASDLKDLRSKMLHLEQETDILVARLNENRL